jgi:hypothetical protein
MLSLLFLTPLVSGKAKFASIFECLDAFWSARQSPGFFQSSFRGLPLLVLVRHFAAPPEPDPIETLAWSGIKGRCGRSNDRVSARLPAFLVAHPAKRKRI